jgi:transketolase C-terminal domain/subunit
MIAIIQRVFFERGLRFVFSTRSKVPWILKEDGKTKFFGDGYEFIPGKDETILDGKAGYVVSFGEMLYRSLDAVMRCREIGLDVGLINKPTLNIVDEEVTTFFLKFRTFVNLGISAARPPRRLDLVHLSSSSSLTTERLA